MVSRAEHLYKKHKNEGRRHCLVIGLQWMESSYKLGVSKQQASKLHSPSSPKLVKQAKLQFAKITVVNLALLATCFLLG